MRTRSTDLYHRVVLGLALMVIASAVAWWFR